MNGHRGTPVQRAARGTYEWSCACGAGGGEPTEVAARLALVVHLQDNPPPRPDVAPTAPAPASERLRQLRAAQDAVGAAAMAAQSPAADTRPIRTRDEAALYAVVYLRRLGYADAAPAPTGAPDGVHVRATGIVGTVHLGTVAADLDTVRRIHRARRLAPGVPVAFSFSGYSPAAMNWADQHDVALITCRHDRTSHPANVAGGALAYHPHR